LKIIHQLNTSAKSKILVEFVTYSVQGDR